MPIKYSLEDFIVQSTIAHAGKYSYHLISKNNWRGIHHNLKIYCIEHKITFEVSGEWHIKGKGLCPKCLHEIRSNVGREVMMERLIENPDFHKELAQKLKNDIDKNGLNSYERNNQRIALEGKNDIDENGLNRQQRAKRKSNNTLRNDVDENGKDGIERITEKRIQTQRNNIDEHGQNTFQRAARKRIDEGREDIDPITGLNRLERAMQKSIAERMSDKKKWEKEVKARIDAMRRVDEQGLDGWDRSFISALKLKIYKETEIYYQGLNEFNFLQNLENENGLFWVQENVKRGTQIKYHCPIQNKNRIYKPDFIINDILYEIKSPWTWNRKGEDFNLELVNKAKLNTAKKYYSRVFLILNNEMIEWKTSNNMKGHGH